MISIVFCHHKGRLIDRALASAKKQEGIVFETIVLTSDKDYFHLFQRANRSSKVKCYYAEGGPAVKRNLAIKVCKYHYIAFFDDDTELRPDTCLKMYESLKEEGVGMVFGKLLKMDNPKNFDEAGGFLTWAGFIWARGDKKQDNGQFDTIEPIFAGKSAACMIKRDVFIRAGLFDPTFEILGEESDLAWRVWLIGEKVLYVPTSVTLHAFDTPLKPLDFYSHRRIYYNGCRNYLMMLASNLEMKNALRIVSINMLAWMVAGTGMLLRGKFQAGLWIWKGILHFLTHFKHLAKRRKLLRDIRKVSDEELFKTIYKSPHITYYLKRVLNYWKTGLHG